MTKEKFKKAIDVIGIPRLIVFLFFAAVVLTAYVNGINVVSFLSSTIKYWGMWGVLVLAMVPTIKCGIGPNFGVSLGIVCGLFGTLLAIEFNIAGVVGGAAGPWASMGFAILVAIITAWFVGVGYGRLLNMVKGSEMTVTTYIGYSIIYLLCILWFRMPFKSGEIIWPLGGVGVRNSVALEGSFAYLLNNAGSFTIGGEEGFFFPTGLVVFVIAMCLIVHFYFKSKTGLAIEASGANPTFARASGINVDKMRVKGVTMSTILGAIGIIVYSQGFGYLQVYTAPLAMGFICVASVLIGGATTKKATIMHVLIGTFLYQGLVIFTPPVSNHLLAGTDISDTMRQIIQNGVILYALAKAKGGSNE